MIHRDAREFIVDLCNCPVMDSTFMGTLAGISLWLGVSAIKKDGQALPIPLDEDRTARAQTGQQTFDLEPRYAEFEPCRMVSGDALTLAI
jgi:hypothetical protein